MKNLAELAKLAQALTVEETPCESILVYGDSKTGKTQMVATIAKSKLIDKIYWFNLENGAATLSRMVLDGKLTEEEASKIIMINITDTKEKPYGYETMAKVYTVFRDQEICEAHGRVKCPVCIKDEIKTGWLRFNLKELGKRDCVVLDSGSQFANSIMASLTQGQEIGFKPGWDEYGVQGRVLTDCLSSVQAAWTNHIWITHQISVDNPDDINKDDKLKRDKYYPLVGTKGFSVSIAKYFGSVCYLSKKLNKHVGGSSTTYSDNMITGSRIGMKLEDDIGLQHFHEVFENAKMGKANKFNK